MHKGIAGGAQLYDKADVMSEDKNNIIITNILQLVIIKARQTEFTVYRHNFFCFACGRAVIIQISY